MSAIDILGSFQDPFNFDQGAAKLINVRVVPRDPKEGKKSRTRLVGSPGLTPLCKPTAASCIAISHALETIWTGHADGTIWYGIETGNPQLAGSVAVNPSQPVIRFAEDRTALAIASNANTTPDTGAPPLNPTLPLAGTGYTATPQTGVVNCGFDASINFDPSTVAELNNITIWSAASNYYANQDSKMYSSDPLDPSDVEPNSFATKEARADRVVDLAISGLIMWPLGSRSMEQWYDPGGQTDFAFTAYPNSLIEVGLAARSSLAQLRSLIVFVGTDRRVWLCTGQSGQPISPPWVDLLLQQLTLAQIALLTGYAYGQGGSDFYVLTLPGQWTIELASTTGVWSYRQTPGRSDHASRCAVEHDGGVVYVGMDTGEICILDMNSNSEPAGVLARTIVTSWLGSEESRMTFNSFDVTSSMGAQAGNFQLDWSDTADVSVGGVVVSTRTWKGARQVQMPTPGVRRAIGRGFGTGRRRQFRLQYSGAQAPFTFDEMFLNSPPGT